MGLKSGTLFGVALAVGGVMLGLRRLYKNIPYRYKALRKDIFRMMIILMNFFRTPFDAFSV